MVFFRTLDFFGFKGGTGSGFFRTVGLQWFSKDFWTWTVFLWTFGLNGFFKDVF